MGFGKGGVNKPPSSKAVRREAQRRQRELSARERSQCGQQQRKLSKAVATESRKRGRDYTDGEKTYMLARWGELLSDSCGRKIGVADLCVELAAKFEKEVQPNYFKRSLVKPALASEGEYNGLERQERSDSGVPVIYTDEVMRAIEKQADFWDYLFTFLEMADWLVEMEVCEHASASGVAKALKDNGWNCHYVHRSRCATSSRSSRRREATTTTSTAPQRRSRPRIEHARADGTRGRACGPLGRV